jgi:hypothetical protein
MWDNSCLSLRQEVLPFFLMIMASPTYSVMNLMMVVVLISVIVAPLLCTYILMCICIYMASRQLFSPAHEPLFHKVTQVPNTNLAL